MRMFGASFGSRCGCAGHFMVESWRRGLATLSDIGVGGNGSTEPSSGVAAETGMQRIAVSNRR